MEGDMVMLAKHPRILDPVIVYDGRGTIVQLRAGFAHVDSDDDLRVQVPVDRLRWFPAASAWVIDRAEPLWLHEDPAFIDHPADATVASEYGR